MAWDNVPWFVGGGALHSPEVARLLAYSATNGAEGVVGVDDLSVVPLSPAGTSIRALPGACLILNRATGGSQQTYAARLVSEDVVAVSPTGSTSGRNDLVVARVEDPFMAGEPWQAPADPATGQYVFTRIIPNVPASAVASSKAASDYLAAQGFSAIPLAGLIIPANTATVDGGMIRNLRKVARPRRERAFLTLTPSTDDAVTSATYATWPKAASWTVEVPAWATKMIVRGEVALGYVPRLSTTANGQATGHFRAKGGTVVTSTVFYDFDVASGSAFGRFNVVAGGTYDVPLAMRGTSQTFSLQAEKVGGNVDLHANTYSFATLEVEFLEVA